MNLQTRPKSAVLAVAVAIGMGISPTPAAAENETQLCQGAGAELTYKYYTSSGTIANWIKNCSGTYSLNSRGYYLHAGGWSGWITFDGGDTDYFCDWWAIPLTQQRVIEIKMSSYKIWECGG